MNDNNYYDPYAKHEENSSPAASAPEYAGFWIRLVACIVDGFVLGAISMVIMVPLFFVMIVAAAFISPSGDDSANAGLGSIFCCAYCMVFIVAIVAQWLYYAWFESSKYMATPGKMLLGLVVVDENTGGRLTFAQASLRLVAKILTNVVFYIGYIAIAFSSRKQGLYDMIAHTLVVKKQQ